MCIDIITCTGWRPEIFKLCTYFLFNQTYKGPINWHIVDDSHTIELPAGVPSHIKINYIKAPILWTPDVNTQRSNTEEALKHLTGDYIFTWEDDEAYLPQYIETMLAALQHSHLVGIANSRYYNVSFQGWTEMKNFKHASLSQTALTREALPLLTKAVNSGHFYFDIQIWKAALEQNLPVTLIANTSLSIGMKGLPGRPGLTPGHRDRKGFIFDPGAEKLKQWLPEHWQLYEKYLKNSNVKTSARQQTPSKKD